MVIENFQMCPNHLKLTQIFAKVASSMMEGQSIGTRIWASLTAAVDFLSNHTPLQSENSEMEREDVESTEHGLINHLLGSRRLERSSPKNIKNHSILFSIFVLFHDLLIFLNLLDLIITRHGNRGSPMRQNRCVYIRGLPRRRVGRLH